MFIMLWISTLSLFLGFNEKNVTRSTPRTMYFIIHFSMIALMKMWHLGLEKAVWRDQTKWQKLSKHSWELQDRCWQPVGSSSLHTVVKTQIPGKLIFRIPASLQADKISQVKKKEKKKRGAWEEFIEKAARWPNCVKNSGVIVPALNWILAILFSGIWNNYFIAVLHCFRVWKTSDENWVPFGFSYWAALNGSGILHLDKCSLISVIKYQLNL